jgi:hypothetical protein
MTALGEVTAEEIAEMRAQAARGGYRPDGHQGNKPAMVNRRENGRMIGERPGPGGNGRYGAPKRPISKAASPKQIDYIAGLVAQLPADQQGPVRAFFERSVSDGTLTGGFGGTASKMIDALKEHVARARAQSAQTARPERKPLPEVPNGYYAVDTDNGLRFYRVKNHKNGRVYLDAQASDNLHRVPFGAYAGILGAIAADPEAAGKRYADEIGCCYRCNRTLTDEESRTFGTGPDCGNRR